MSTKLPGEAQGSQMLVNTDCCPFALSVLILPAMSMLWAGPGGWGDLRMNALLAWEKLQGALGTQSLPKSTRGG